MCERRRRKNKRNTTQRRTIPINQNYLDKVLIYIENGILKKLVPTNKWLREIEDFGIKSQINTEFGLICYNLNTKEIKIFELNRENIHTNELNKFVRFTKKLLQY
jgi:hypothetical protein